MKNAQRAPDFTGGRIILTHWRKDARSGHDRLYAAAATKKRDVVDTTPAHTIDIESVTVASVSESKVVDKGQIPLRYLVADRFEAGRRPAASWNLAYHPAC